MEQVIKDNDVNFVITMMPEYSMAYSEILNIIVGIEVSTISFKTVQGIIVTKHFETKTLLKWVNKL